jgi:GTPase SAR1 family protein
MAVKILILGLPGSGKTYFAERLKTYLEQHSTVDHIPAAKIGLMEALPRFWRATVDWFNADDVRRRFNDWDFSRDGRIRQSLRMAEFALSCTSDFVICDFVAPLPEMRTNFGADWTIWMDTIDSGRFEDTNRVFVQPDIYDFRIVEQNAEHWVKVVGDHILNNRRRPLFDWSAPTAQLLGRYQPWHSGHRALFERALQKTGQVCIMVRQCPVDERNPFRFTEVQNRILRDLDPLYQGLYQVLPVPDIVRICYGRDVGYTIEQETFDDTVHQISATNIRNKMKEQGLL